MPGGEEFELDIIPKYVAGEAQANSQEEEEGSDKYGDARGEYTFGLPLLRDVERSVLGYCDRRSSTRLPNDPPRDTIVSPAAGSPLPSIRDQAVMPIHPVVSVNPVRGFERLVEVVEGHAARRGGDQIGRIILRHKEPIFCQDGMQYIAEKVRSSSIDHWSSPRLPYWARCRTPRSTVLEELEGENKNEGRGDGEDEIFDRLYNDLDQTRANIQQSKQSNDSVLQLLHRLEKR